MAFHFLTLKYKEKKLEKDFSNDIAPDLLLIVEVILSIISLLFIYIYFPIQLKSSIIMIIFISIELILTLILIRFYEILLNKSILRHLLASFYLLSPLIIILININLNCKITLSVFVLFISSYLTLGVSLSHLFKIFLAIISISIYLPFIIFKKEIKGLLKFFK